MFNIARPYFPHSDRPGHSHPCATTDLVRLGSSEIECRLTIDARAGLGENLEKLPSLQYNPSPTNRACVFVLLLHQCRDRGAGQVVNVLSKEGHGPLKPLHTSTRVQAGRQARLGHSLPSEKLAGAVSQRTDSHDIEGSLPPHPLSLLCTEYC